MIETEVVSDELDAMSQRERAPVLLGDFRISRVEGVRLDHTLDERHNGLVLKKIQTDDERDQEHA